MSNGIYVHIPFCAKKCLYCDFNSTDKAPELKDAYTDALIAEIKGGLPDFADTVFIGGGTPSVLGIHRLLKVIEVLPKTPEFTVEINPKTVDAAGFELLKEAGVNRISMGIQSANDNELISLGRIHTFSEAEESFHNAREAGFSNINTDIMFSVPNQSFESFRNTLEKIVALNPEHISCYSLIIEEGTPFYDMDLKLPTEEDDRKMYDYAVCFLRKNGYIQYEISNFAKPGYECRHNLKYWNMEDYYGFGAGAHSLINRTRHSNSYDIKEYITDNKKENLVLSEKDRENEFIFLALRKNEGISFEKYSNLFKKDFAKTYRTVIDTHKKNGLLEETATHIFLTKDGFSLSNTVMSDFYTL